MRNYSIQPDTIDITGLSKAAVLAALYNASRPLGMGFLHYDPKPMTEEEAAEHLKESTHFDYLKGRVMKIDLSSDKLQAHLYDRDNGPGQARRVIKELIKSRQTNTPTLEDLHRSGVVQSAAEAKMGMEEPDGWESPGVYKMTLADQKENLEPKVEEALKKVKKAR